MHTREQSARLIIAQQEFSLPVIVDNQDQQHLDVRDFHQKSGMFLYDPGLINTAIAQSTITWIDSQNDKLYYRGYDVEDLCRQSSFVEVSYLLAYGSLPAAAELEQYSRSLSNHSLIHESMKNFFDSFPGDAHPLAILATMVTALSSYYPKSYEFNKSMGIDITVRLLAKVRTLAAWSYKRSIGQPVIYPRDELPYWTNFLNMMFALPVEHYSVDPMDDEVLNKLMILYCDHEQNIATATVRMLASTKANLFVCINAGISAFWGSKEAAWEVLTVPMIEHMLDNRMSPESYFQDFINGMSRINSSAFGHAKYKQLDPRVRVARDLFHTYLKKKEAQAWQIDAFTQKALEVEEFTTQHTLFKEKGLYPNLDFYSALIFHLMGIPENMGNSIRVIGKLPGWLAHWQEQRLNEQTGSMRPQQIYSGPRMREWQPIDKR
ncbi:MAG: citrate synthase [Leptospiraceae bacterium]|nr:citrate synthase [Leptospiraceae bacterium]